MSAAVTPPLRLSIVVPSHSTRELTLRCLETVLGAKSDRVEVILVDDASTDGTSAAVRAAHPAVRLLRNETAVGFTRAANQGADAADGDVIVFLNSDTEVDSEAWRVLRRAFDSDPQLGIAGGALRYPDGTPQWSGGPAPSHRWLFVLASGVAVSAARLPFYRRLRPVSAASGSTPVDWVTGAAMAIRRSTWAMVGPFDESFRFYGQDLDLCMRARQAGWNVTVIRDLRVLHHHGGTIGTRKHLELLFSDLMHWATKTHDRRWVDRARKCLRWGVRLQLAVRRASSLFVRPSRREAYEELNAELASTLTSLQQP
jgi:GT2 family glycosyltransferase